ncbi:beta-lactamase family protein [Streptomyces lydicamycinicus]|uniref:serine hydrolase domain-containing protein n=1 Tax=Streptomyces lydicamycinicus TaxID=1546107 RepID=UPI0020363834|nr:serine hydrolase domain-containing protein [Streptomyces lydicamycinicus]USA04766.1 beta-lactamase family protein [Streptomyces lydicamycinicus]
MPVTPHRRRMRLAGTATAALLALTIPTTASATTAPTTDSSNATTAGNANRSGIDRAALKATLNAFHHAGMYGAYSAVRDGAEEWQGASGVADVDTGRPTTPQMRHRIGSITKTFTAVAVLQEVSKGHIELDAPIGRYLSGLVPGERGRAITVRMLLNHTSGIGDYAGAIFPSADSIEGNRFRQFDPRELARLGLKAEPLGKPGQAHHYSNTNFVLAGLLLQKITGKSPEAYITEHVIRKAGLRHTYFPRSAYLTGPHAKMYEAAYGGFNPPRDFSVYNGSWAGTAGSLVSTMADLNRFYRALLGGELLAPAQLRQMKTTVPIEGSPFRYGLGLFTRHLPCGEFWGHNGLVLGAMTWSMSSADGKRQMSLGFNLTRYQKLDGNGVPQTGPIDAAMNAHVAQALCGTSAGRPPGATETNPFNSLLVAPQEPHLPIPHQ